MLRANQLCLPTVLRERIITRARQETPLEIVGILGGRTTGCAERDIPLKNVSADPSSFLVDPFEQFLVERSLKSRGEQIVAIYHSHPAGDAAFTDLDRVFAAAWACVHVVVGLIPVVQVKAYSFAQQHRVLEVPIVDR